MDDLATQPLVAFVNAFAGVYAACVWGFFGVLRARARAWLWVLADVTVSTASAGVAVAYWFLATNPIRMLPWVEALRLLVVPVLVLPTVVHVALWRETRVFLHRAEEVDGDVE